MYYNNNPEYARIGDRKYKINTDFRFALKCQEIAKDTSIGEYERALAIIYTLYGDEGLKHQEDQEKLLEIAITYLKCGEDNIEESNEKPDMDFKQDYKFIEASFKSDYGITLKNEEIHWWDFYMYINGLTDKCVLNRIRELRTYDTSQIKDAKERAKINKMKKRFALEEKERPITEDQKTNADKFYELTGIKRRE